MASSNLTRVLFELRRDHKTALAFFNSIQQGTCPSITPLQREIAYASGVMRPDDSFRRSPMWTRYWSSVRVNPHDENRSALIKEYFVWGDQNQKKNKHYSRYGGAQFINENKHSLEDFVNRAQDNAVALAKAMRTGEPEPDGLNRADLIIGLRGCGKTFLQNYILSEYSSTFDKKKVVWIRINLVREWGQENLDHNINFTAATVAAWVNAQITKVLCRYYDDKSKRWNPENTNVNPINFFEAILDEVDEELINMERFQGMMSQFRLPFRSATENNLNPDWIDGVAAEAAVEIAMKRGYSFIVVFDGLDLLDHSSRLRPAFHYRCAAIAEYLTKESQCGMYHLVFLRPESEIVFSKELDLRYRNAPYSNKSFGNFIVLPVNLRDLYKKRIQALTSPEISGKFGIDFREIEFINEYIKSEKCNVAGDISDYTYIEALSNVQDSNTRAGVQLLNAALERFWIASEHTRGKNFKEMHLPYVRSGDYHLTETMMLGGDRVFPPLAPIYRKEEIDPKKMGSAEGLKFIYRPYPSSGLRQIYDTNFLPGIFHFPHVEAPSIATFGNPSGSMLLINLRLLQITAIFSKQMPLASYPRASVSSLFVIMQDFFKYQKEETMTAIFRLIDDELIVLGEYEGLNEPEEMSRRVIITTKGRMILDHYIFDVTYLHLATYNLPCPKEWFKNSCGFEAVRADSKLSLWVAAKIYNAIILLKIIEVVNEEQEKFVKLKMPQFDEKEKKLFKQSCEEVTKCHGGMFSFTNRMTERVYHTSELIVNSLVPEHYQGISRDIEEILFKKMNSSNLDGIP